MSKNTCLRYLDISNNKLKPTSLKKWADILGKTALRHLDLCYNDVKDEGTMFLIRGLRILNEGKT
jgi:Ran GTPase-activating protein (RanGAP) involved in mRNA processing and transport